MNVSENLLFLTRAALSKGGRSTITFLSVFASAVISLSAVSSASATCTARVTHNTSYPADIGFRVDGNWYQIGPNQTAVIPLLAPSTLSLWMCVSTANGWNCSYGQFQIAPGQAYRAVDAGEFYGMAIVPDGVPFGCVDIKAVSFAWNPNDGGAKFSYKVTGATLPSTVTAIVYWTGGQTVPWALPIFTTTIPAGTTGSGYIKIPGNLLTQPPNEARDLLLALDPDQLLQESNKANNQKRLADVTVTPTGTVSAYSIGIVKDLLRQAGRSACTITSTVRTKEKQAEIMFNNEFSDPGSGYSVYAAPGRAVLDEYHDMADGLSSAQILAQKPAILATMVAEIEWQVPYNVSKHIATPEQFAQRNVFDISPWGWPAQSGFLFCQAATSDGRVLRVGAPDGYSRTFKDTYAFHLEIDQTAKLVQPLCDTLSKYPVKPATAATQPAPSISKGLSITKPITLMDGFNCQGGIVSTGRNEFTFHLRSGDKLGLGCLVTNISQGTVFSNDDSVIYLVDNQNKVSVWNHIGLESGYQSYIGDFTATNEGRYSVIVTTFGNNPVFETNGCIRTWEDDGGSSIAYELHINYDAINPSLIIGRSDDDISIDWMKGILQSCLGLGGVWFDQTNASPPHVLSQSESARFFRLKQ